MASGISGGATPLMMPTRAEALRDLIGASSGVGTAAGEPHEGKARDVQRIRQRQNVGGPVEDRPAGLEVRETDAGTVGQDQAHAQAGGGLGHLRQGAFQARIGRAVEVQDGLARRVAVLGVAQAAPIAAGGSIGLCWRS